MPATSLPFATPASLGLTLPRPALPSPRLRLGRSWMGWKGHVSVNPYTGLQFFDLKFKGQRVVYELALKELYAGESRGRGVRRHQHKRCIGDKLLRLATRCAHQGADFACGSSSMHAWQTAALAVLAPASFN